jgi:hypothetical protein
LNNRARILGRTAIGAAGPVAMILTSVGPAQAAVTETIPNSNCTVTAGDARGQIVNGTHKIVVDGNVSCPEQLAVSVSAQISWSRGGSLQNSDWFQSPTSSSGSASVSAYIPCSPGYNYLWNGTVDGRIYPYAANQKYLRVYSYSDSHNIICPP